MKKLIAFFLLLSAIQQAKAQVPVHEEPRHHVVFKNKKTRILNVLLPAGDTTQYHLHSTPSVFISLSKTKTASQLMGAQPSGPGISIPGNIAFENLAAPNTRKHRVWNEDNSTYHVIDVELFTDKTPFQDKPLTISHIQPITDTGWVRTYKIELNKGDQVTIPGSKSAFLLIAIDDQTAAITKNAMPIKTIVHVGDFLWINAGDKITILNEHDPGITFALLELK